jgi:hypothetical protein
VDERSPLADEDADLREGLTELGPGALADLKRVLEAPQTYRDALLRQFIARPQLADLATLIAIANSDEVVPLRLLRAIRDVKLAGQPFRTSTCSNTSSSCAEWSSAKPHFSSTRLEPTLWSATWAYNGLWRSTSRNARRAAVA